MRLLACLIAATAYLWREQMEFSFSQLQFAVFILILTILSVRLCLFLRGPTRIQPPKRVADVLRFIGRHTLEIYAIELAGFQLIAMLLDLEFDASSLFKDTTHMTQNDSAWINKMFSQLSQEVTPAAARDAACVLFAPFSPNLEAAGRCASILSDQERERSDRFVTKELKTRFEQRRAFRRYCGALALRSTLSLSRIIFEETENGRPYLRDRPDLWFSFSSCRLGFIGAWSSTHELGVDLEDQPIGREVAELAQMYFTESEARTVREHPARLRTFLKLWSLKEAALKSIGQGLSFGLDVFEFELAGRLRVVDAPEDHGGPERFRAHCSIKRTHAVRLSCGFSNSFPSHSCQPCNF